MLLVLCVDLDDDVGRKTDVTTPVVGRDEVEAAAVALATNDPADSDVNVLFEGVRVHDDIDAAGDTVEVAAVTGVETGGVAANRAVGEEVDEVLARLGSEEPVQAIVVTDGAQDESVLPTIRSRVPIDGVQRVVVRQAQDLESMYYTLKQVLDDPETRGTILVPLGVLLLMYPLAVIADALGLPGLVLGVSSALVGLYALFRGLGLETTIDETVERARQSLYAGRVVLLTYIVAAALVLVGGVQGFAELETVRGVRPTPLGIGVTVSAFVQGALQWVAAAGLTSSFGQITDEYLHDRFEWRYLNAPVYIIAIAGVLHAVSAFLLGRVDLNYLAGVLTAGTLVGVLSTLAFAVVESRRARPA